MSKTLDNALALPTLGAGTEGQFLRVDADESGYDLAEFYEEAIVDLTSVGDFTAGTLKCVRVGNVVTISNTSALTHPEGTSADSGGGVIPESMRPVVDPAYSVFGAHSATGLTGDLISAGVTSNGGFFLLYDLAHNGIAFCGSLSYCV